MPTPLKDFQKFKWSVLKTQGKVSFELSDASCFYEALSEDSPDLLEWVNFLKFRNTAFVLAKGTALLGRANNRLTVRYCIFTAPGWQHYTGIYGKYSNPEYPIFHNGKGAL